MSFQLPFTGSRTWRPALVALACLATLPAAQAALFEDEDARKAILELRQRISSNEAGQKVAQDEAKARADAVQDQLKQLRKAQDDSDAVFRRSLLDLSEQIEALRKELAQLRGQNEQLAKDLAFVQRQLKNNQDALDDRFQKLEPKSVTLDGQTFLAKPEETAAYEQAVAALRSGDFNKGAAALASFLQVYPASGYGLAVRYWLGMAQYGKREYKDAVATLRGFVDSAAPNDARAPEAWLTLANCYAEMKDRPAHKRTLEELVKRFPDSEAGVAAKDRLTKLK